MRRVITSIALFAAVAALAAGCAERKSPTDSAIRAHPVGWASPEAEPFHGLRVIAGGVESCRGCHGADLRGKGKANDCSQCHEGGAGGHPAASEWLSPTSEEFHARAVEVAGPGPCGACHGEDYRGGWSGASCYRCHAGGPSGHPEGWLSPPSPNFHGLAVFARPQGDCSRCHAGIDGGVSGVPCSRCH